MTAAERMRRSRAKAALLRARDKAVACGFDVAVLLDLPRSPAARNGIALQAAAISPQPGSRAAHLAGEPLPLPSMVLVNMDWRAGGCVPML